MNSASLFHPGNLVHSRSVCVCDPNRYAVSPAARGEGDAPAVRRVLRAAVVEARREKRSRFPVKFQPPYVEVDRRAVECEPASFEIVALRRVQSEFKVHDRLTLSIGGRRLCCGMSKSCIQRLT